MRVLVTGAGGFLGQHVVAALRAEGHAVRALLRAGSDSRGSAGDDQVVICRGDLCQAATLAGMLDGIDSVVHLAAQLRGTNEQKIEATLSGTRNLLEAMALSGARRLVLASSFSVYDWRRIEGKVDERSPVVEEDVQGLDGYAMAKIGQERLARQSAQARGWELVVLRPGMIWGKGHLAVPNLGQRLGPLQAVIAPGGPMPLTYVENCALAFVRAVNVPEAAGLVVNVVDDEPVSAWDYAGGPGRSGLRVPVPYGAGLLMAKLAGTVNRAVFGNKAPLPGLLRARQFEARFKRVQCPNEVLRQRLRWRQPYNFQAAWDRASTAREASNA